MMVTTTFRQAHRNVTYRSLDCTGASWIRYAL